MRKPNGKQLRERHCRQSHRCSSIGKLKMHAVNQSMSSNSMELTMQKVSANGNPLQGDRYLAPTPGTMETTTTRPTNSALRTQVLGKIGPTKGGGFRVKWTNAPPLKERMLSIGRNITYKNTIQGWYEANKTSLPLATGWWEFFTMQKSKRQPIQ